MCNSLEISQAFACWSKAALKFDEETFSLALQCTKRLFRNEGSARANLFGPHFSHVHDFTSRWIDYSDTYAIDE